MIRTVSLLPLAAGLLSMFLGAVSLTGVKPVSRSVRYFVGLNACTAAWSLAYFFLLNIPGPSDPAVAPFASLPHLLAIVEAIGIGGAPTYWFLFAASYARRESWAQGRVAALAHLPLVYTVVCVASNPLHRLFVVSAAPDGSAVYGPLMWPHQAVTYLLVGLGTWLFARTAWQRATVAARRQAIVVCAAVAVPTLAGALYAVRGALGLAIPVHPSPVLFPALNMVLAYELLRTGLGDVVPYATLQAFNAISDAAIAVDQDGLIAAVNTAGKQLFPGAEPGVLLGEVAPELVESAQPCLTSRAAYAGFDLERDDRVYWGRVRPTRDQRGKRMGCLLLLTDVTEVRLTQAKLALLNGDAGASA